MVWADNLHQTEDRHHDRCQDTQHQAQAGRGEEEAVLQLEAGRGEVDEDGEDLAEGHDDEARLCGCCQPSGHFPGPGGGGGDVLHGRGMEVSLRLLTGDMDLPIVLKYFPF